MKYNIKINKYGLMASAALLVLISFVMVSCGPQGFIQGNISYGQANWTGQGQGAGAGAQNATTQVIVLTTAPQNTIINMDTVIIVDLSREVQEPGQIRNVTICYGTSSVPNPTKPSDYPNTLMVQCNATCDPSQISGRLNITSPGDYYYRVYAVVGTKEIWSREVKLRAMTQSQQNGTGTGAGSVVGTGTSTGGSSNMTGTQNVSGTTNQTQTNSTQTNTTDINNGERYTIYVDSDGFYQDGTRISSLNVQSDRRTRIVFNVIADGIGADGVSIQGCGEDTGLISTGGSALIMIDPDSDCTINAYSSDNSTMGSRLDINVE